jgi:hypothetical protein
VVCLGCVYVAKNLVLPGKSILVLPSKFNTNSYVVQFLFRSIVNWHQTPPLHVTRSRSRHLTTNMTHYLPMFMSTLRLSGRYKPQWIQCDPRLYLIICWAL